MRGLAAKSRIAFKVLIIAPIVIAIILLVHIVYIYRFNKISHQTISDATSSSVYMHIDGRDDSTSEWMKRDYDLYGETVDLNARTIDGTFYNNSKYKVKDWTMTMFIEDDCMLNNAWNGLVEIHQHVYTNEQVQSIDLSDYNLDDITLDYLYDGDLLIPLDKGDYFVYYPSTEYHEMPVSKNFKITMGFILYYLDTPDISNYVVTYHYQRAFTDGHLFWVVVILFALWMVSLLMYIASLITYKNAVKEMEIKKNGILSVSDIYSIIYIIDIAHNELSPLVADEESEKLRPHDLDAQTQLKQMIDFDCSDAYVEVMKEFCDLTTLDERLANKNTIVLEYMSKNYGWCRLRFFAMDRVADQPLTKAVFTIQVINEEKAELEAISSKVEEAEKESKAKSVFLANMSHEIRTPINTVIGLDTMILREAKDSAIKSYARDIKSAANMLLSLINGVLDYSKMEAGRMELVPAEYSLKEMVHEVSLLVKNRLDAKNLEFKLNVSPTVPDKLYGDNVRLKQILVNLLTNAAKYTDEGSVEFSIFGKIDENTNKVHFLMSVKDTGIGIKDEDLSLLTERFARLDLQKNRNVEGTGLGLSLVTGLLELMDSKLQVISNYGEGSEFYFELEQDVVDRTPIGDVNFDELPETEDETYEASFVAEDVNILAVDDNPLNLTVIKNLLKETKVKIDTADSGVSALEKTLQKEYDLIYMDHMMPEMDGLECFKRLKVQENGLNQKTPVIMLTANSSVEQENEYLNLGFTDFLSKPINPTLLEEKTAKYLPLEKMKKGSKKQTKAEEQTLPAITGVDATYGIQHTGSFDSMISVMEQFNNIAETDLKALSEFADALRANNDDEAALDSYRIKVHSMKSSANVFGGLQVSGLAAMLERAAQNKNVKEVIDITPYFLNEWEELNKDVSGYFKENQSNEDKKTDTSGLNELLHQLDVSMKVYDVSGADMVMKEIEKYALDEKAESLVDDLKKAVANLNAEEVTKICNILKF